MPNQLVLFGRVPGLLGLAMPGTETERVQLGTRAALLRVAAVVAIQSSSNGCVRSRLFTSHVSRLSLADLDDCF